MQAIRNRCMRLSMHRLPADTSRKIVGLATGLTVGTLALFADVAHAEEEPAPQQPKPAPKEQKRRVKRRVVKKVSMYPGKFEDHSKESKDILEFMNFAGARFAYSRVAFPNADGPTMASIQKQCIGSMQISMAPTGSTIDYTTQSFFNGGKQILVAQATVMDKRPFIAHGRAILNEVLVKPLSLKLGGSILGADSLQNMGTLEIDFKGSDFAAQARTEVTARGGNAYSFNYFQSLTPAFAAGAELSLVHKLGNGIVQTGVGGAMRYSTLKKRADGEVYSLAYKNFDNAVQLSYVRRVTQALSLSTSITHAFQSGSPFSGSKMETGFSIKRATFQYSAAMNSEGKVRSTLDTALLDNGAVRFSLSAMLDQASHESEFGYGVSIG